jgi:hypothetical protein
MIHALSGLGVRAVQGPLHRGGFTSLGLSVGDRGILKGGGPSSMAEEFLPVRAIQSPPAGTIEIL